MRQGQIQIFLKNSQLLNNQSASIVWVHDCNSQNKICWNAGDRENKTYAYFIWGFLTELSTSSKDCNIGQKIIV